MKRRLSVAIALTMMPMMPMMLVPVPGSAAEISRNSIADPVPPFFRGVRGDLAAGNAPGELLLLAAECECDCPETPEPDGLGLFDPLSPYLISPRSTLILDDRPTISWNEVPGATSYTVRIVTEEGEIWSQENVTGTEIVYPGDPPLQPGTYYLAIVVADTGASSQEEDVPGRTFRLLGADRANSVREAIAVLDGQQLSRDEKALLQAYLYIGYYLRADAIETLESSVAAGSQNPEIYRLLGNLYETVALTPLAEERYLKAIELYEALGNLERVQELQQRIEELYR